MGSDRLPRIALCPFSTSHERLVSSQQVIQPAPKIRLTASKLVRQWDRYGECSVTISAETCCCTQTRDDCSIWQLGLQICPQLVIRSTNLPDLVCPPRLSCCLPDSPPRPALSYSIQYTFKYMLIQPFHQRQGFSECLIYSVEFLHMQNVSPFQSTSNFCFQHTFVAFQWTISM